jgi:hypothetical protein
VQSIAEEIERRSSSTNASAKTVTLKEAFWSNPQYVRCQWVNVWQIIFHELSGINIIYIYSNILLKRILVPGSIFTPTTGTYMIGLVNVVSFLVAVWTI